MMAEVEKDIFCQGPLVKVDGKVVYGVEPWWDGKEPDHEDGVFITVKKCLRYKCTCPKMPKERKSRLRRG